MTLYEELYFEITLTGAKSEIKKLISYLRSGELDDFFEFSTEYINYDDSYSTATDDAETSVVLSNDDYGIEIDEFDVYDFLDVFCRAAKGLSVVGQLYDIDDEEFNFESAAGSADYVDKKSISVFNQDELLPEEKDED